MSYSDFATQFSGSSAIVDLMEDLGEALNVNPDILFLGGGNPAYIPEFEDQVSIHLTNIAKDKSKLHKLIGVYQSPQGSEEFIDALVAHFTTVNNWEISKHNITITNGSQSAFFSLINMFTGSAGQANKKILLPLVPEYLGYCDQGLMTDSFSFLKPKIEILDDSFFQYLIDFKNLEMSEDISALCVSCPTNPTGKVLREKELQQLNSLSIKNNIPLILDCAYGYPFPGILFDGGELKWQPNQILVLSLSKLGLPGARTGIVVAHEDVIQKLVSINTIVNLASGNFGPALLSSILNSKQLPQITKDIIQPYYKRKCDFIVGLIRHKFSSIEYKIHLPQGAFFVWLWFPKLSISSTALYERLKEKGVLIMDGKHFFFGLHNEWQHANQCIRLSYCQDEAVIEEAISIIAQEICLLGE